MKPNQAYFENEILTLLPEENGLRIQRSNKPDVIVPWPMLWLGCLYAINSAEITNAELIPQEVVHEQKH